MGMWVTLAPNHPCWRYGMSEDNEVRYRHERACKWRQTFGACRFTRPLGKKAAKQARRRMAT